MHFHLIFSPQTSVFPSETSFKTYIASTVEEICGCFYACLYTLPNMSKSIYTLSLRCKAMHAYLIHLIKSDLLCRMAAEPGLGLD